MATVSTVPTVKAGLVSRFSTALVTASLSGGQVPVTYAWPGPSAAPECVFLGPHPETADIRVDLSHTIPTIKSGRKQRQESYTIPVTVWCWRPDLTSSGAATAEAQAFALAGHLEDELADDVQAGLGSVVQKITVDEIRSTLFPFQKGWGCELTLDLLVEARLT